MVSPETTINNGTNRQGQSKRSRPKKPIHTPNLSNQRILLLHGNRQSGQLFLGRLDRLRKRILKELHLDFVAPEAPFPHPEDPHLRTWWNRHDDVYNGLDESLDLLHREFIQDENEIVGILGFSQGARLAHLVALLHTENPEKWFPGLRFVIMVAGYDAPLPDGFRLSSTAQQISIPSLHVWGLADPLILPDQAQAVTKFYEEPEICIHDGKHYVPSKGPQIQSFVDFISLHVREITLNSAEVKKDEKSQFPFGDTELVSTTEIQSLYMQVPDEESALMQQEEVQALEAIFPDEINFKSSKKEVDYEEVFDHPIIYDMKLLPSSAEDDIKKKNWPTRPLLLRVEYPYNYPLEEIPKFQLIHNNNIYEFPSLRVATVMNILKETATMELGMPSILSCVYAAKDYLDSPVCDNETHTIPPRDEGQAKENNEDIDETLTSIIKRSPPEEIIKCTLEGLDIAESLLRSSALNNPANTGSNTSSRQGGSFWTYTIGLVGKPSAGKSTFFNAATAFSRQRGDVEGDSEWGGASMAAHPFTTIDPNIGYCLIPAAPGSCPEDDISGSKNDFGSSHGRDPEGQRFLPVLLKDVAGLVPGAYQGRGRGNKFLNDLCDATVLIHVLDASGTADAQGNTTVTRDDAEFTNPIDDLAWIRNELVEWVYSNLSVKWDTIVRKGRHKVSHRGEHSGCLFLLSPPSNIHLMPLDHATFSFRACSVGMDKERRSHTTFFRL